MFKLDALGKLLLRLTVGILMLFHGIAKLNDPGSIAFIGKQLTAVGFPAFIAYGAYVGEIIAPLMLYPSQTKISHPWRALFCGPQRWKPLL